MNFNKTLFKNDEKAIFDLRSIYQKYGYSQYKMSKFEEYDLYVKNKNFLVSDNIITFTDTNGKLMALKPDVTLSIIKNTEDNLKGVQKLYYNENVYRVSKGTLSYKEIMQVGLECIGDIDDYNIFEVISLACQSLNAISEDYILDISHLGIISNVVNALNLRENEEKEIYKCISEKNIHGVEEICKKQNCDCSTLKKMISSYGTFADISELLNSLNCKEEVSQLRNIISALENQGLKNKIRIDFSVTSDTNYYNGFVFKGFINGISSAVLTGGQYDNLMNKMKKSSKAIGFAVYLDLLERLNSQIKNYDVDCIILYNETADISLVNDTAKKMISEGKIVSVQKSIPDNTRYKQLIKIDFKGVQTIEYNA